MAEIEAWDRSWWTCSICGDIHSEVPGVSAPQDARSENLNGAEK